ncbi:UNVERIFIED_CONTAM: hypothetical protein Sradi_5846800 [Sesamum radiatum]|uniref:Uncharacterized protein n=1 Tax=Sesamum radiatum TaxID=300843 RepID=A0AAW2KPQ2_SESRA
MGGAFGKMTILGMSVPGSADRGIIVVVDPEWGAKGRLGSATGYLPGFLFVATLVGVSMIYSRLKLCVPIDGAN